ncbi:hypothetical protein PIB30_096344 [Stylosanthes scabra]|uniref:Uncharacterized protein n=1 Tax=Stylosanthes scabra TaxID=79078 RepID=A0ABU6RWI1_9FABA|nr:hypothetical protein [Stylosanthes scabra]
MGMPVCTWSVENVSKIAKLWGKVIKFDDRTEQSKSYSTARVLLDCYQWERIHEWISVKVEDKSFEGDEVQGEETPYHKNEVGCVEQSWGAVCDVGAIPGSDAIGALGSVFSASGEGVGGPIGIIDAGFGSSDSLSIETLYRLNTEVLVGEQISVGGHGCDDLQNLSQLQVENPNDDGEYSIEEDSLLEVEAAKTV